MSSFFSSWIAPLALKPYSSPQRSCASESYEEFLLGLAKASGLKTPTREVLLL